MTRIALGTLGALVALYGILVAGFYAAMCQPPERFARVMSYVPMPAMMVLPFQTLWGSARGGSLRVGDPAPDFDLASPDGTRRARLSEHRGSRPVVLVFGSYT